MIASVLIAPSNSSGRRFGAFCVEVSDGEDEMAEYADDLKSAVVFAKAALDRIAETGSVRDSSGVR